MATGRRQGATIRRRPRIPDPALHQTGTGATPAPAFPPMATLNPPTDHIIQATAGGPAPRNDEVGSARPHVLVRDDAVDHALSLEVVEDPVRVGCVGCVGARRREEGRAYGCELLGVQSAHPPNNSVVTGGGIVLERDAARPVLGTAVCRA
jgi:hypothetical protein